MPFELPGDLIAFDPRHIWVQRLIWGAVIAVITAVSVPAAIASLVVGATPMGWTIAAVSVAVPTLLMLFAFVIPKWSHRRRGYRWRRHHDEDVLELRQGIWWRSVHVIPTWRVQHADVSQGPLQRMFGLATLTMYTAGTRHASIEMVGLNHQVAVDARDRLIQPDEADRGE